MKLLKKILVILFFVIVIIFIGGYIFVNHIATKGLPDYSTDIQLKGLKDKVTIYRDGFAIPHIYAQNDEDLYRATGYVLAQDRLWQMDFLRRVTQGRLSEIVGKDLLVADQLLRSLRIPERSAKIISKSNKKLINALEAFADGINQYIENNRDNLPPEFTILGYEPEKWEIEHSINLIGYLTWDLSSPAWSTEIVLHKIQQKVDSIKFAQLLPDMGLQKTYVYPQTETDLSEMDMRVELLSQSSKIEKLGFDIFSGSNSWAVSGKKSVTGKPLLSNDMHLGFGAPGIWYQIHQHVKGSVNVMGVLLPGAPFVIVGHNDHIAWGATNVSVDNIDFYIETINPENENQYKLDGEWKDMEIRNEQIKIKGGEVVEKTLRFTHRGPIISKFKKLENKVVSMRWSGSDYSNAMRSVYLFDRATNWTEFKDALSSFIFGGQNINYVDIDGNIGMYNTVAIPIRKGDPKMLFPGETTEYDWKGYVPFDSLPHEYNPERGYVSSANNKTVGDDYPHYISYWFAQPSRIDRIREMLEAKDKLSIDDYKSMLADRTSKKPEKFLPKIIEELEKVENFTQVQAEAFELIKSWDYNMTRNSPSAAIFEYLYICFVKNTAMDELGSKLYHDFQGSKSLVQHLVTNLGHKPLSPWFDNINTTDKKEDFSDIIVKSFIDATDSLQTKLGKNPKYWEWGKIHTLTLQHPLGTVNILNKFFKLNKGPFPVPGSNHTVSPYAFSFNNLFKVKHGASQRHIFSTADWNESLTIIPTGTSGVPASDFYCDQTGLYLQDKYHSDYFDKENIEKVTKFKMLLLPLDGDKSD
ncbi:MAG: penicillin acylase family protein [Bacteroidota bacterium]